MKSARKMKLIKDGEQSLATPRVDIPDLIDRLSEIYNRKKELELREKGLKDQLLMHFRSAGIKTAESQNYIASRAHGSKISWAKENLENIYGKKWIEETEEELLANHCTTDFDYVSIRRKKAKEVKLPEREQNLDEIKKRVEEHFS